MTKTDFYKFENGQLVNLYAIESVETCVNKNEYLYIFIKLKNNDEDLGVLVSRSDYISFLERLWKIS